MRLIVTAMLLPLLTGLGAQDAPPAPATDMPAAICGGDTVRTATPELLSGFGKGGWAIATRVPAAQAFFDNGMQLGAAFAHDASIAAMKEAVRRDPACAMCVWGEAWAGGPTINYGKSAAEKTALLARAQSARRLAADGSVLERALADALVLRYQPDAKDASANLAYARALDAVVRAHPGSNALDTLAADAWLIASLEGASLKRPEIDRSIALLEGVLARDPDYTPAIHFYIHATEIVRQPGRASRYADRLAALAPAASHLLHMPGHTYYWTGRYQDAARANVAAARLGQAEAARLGQAEAARLAPTTPDAVWDVRYHAHNVHFGIGGAMMAGDAEAALFLAEPLVRRAGTATGDRAFRQMVAGMGYAAHGRYADPAAVLALPSPTLPYLTAYWQYARGEAQARLGNAAAVRAEAAAIATSFAKTSDPAAGVAAQMARIAQLVLTGRAATIEGKPKLALAAFTRAARLQEEATFTNFADPPLWWYPVRRSMAEALLGLRRPEKALVEADRVLAVLPADPMTVAVRARALSALGRRAAAQAEARRAIAAWHGDARSFRRSLS
ncbi:hypothetical protein SAMN06297144_2959 [Sphingomonas guangdongensis]|uniref:Tetratricopeptide repeat-containing protein n=1 Tax=Sphingomonas guangdongensis TaxID=1141890 RepID=A0A285R628_9SPHN|nr:hypothetical protein [Sphingomonas guangdongensis]SOB87822.1 hypothetical protein SAMN06297144_2959 [Sphingomonas guangdongensis]